MQPVLFSSLAERPHTYRVMSQYRPARHLPAMLRNARQAGRAPLRRGGRAGKAIASITAPFWGCPQWNRKKKAFHGAGRWWIV